MIVKLKTQQLSNLDQVRSFMAGTAAVAFVVPAHQDRYHWLAQSLEQFGYPKLRRASAGLSFATCARSLATPRIMLAPLA